MYELLKAAPDSTLPDITNLFGFDEMLAKVSQASDGSHDLPYEDINATGATASHPYRRLIERRAHSTVGMIWLRHIAVRRNRVPRNFL